MKLRLSPVLTGVLQAVGLVVFILLLNLAGATWLSAVVSPTLAIVILLFAILCCWTMAFLYPVTLLVQKKIRPAVLVFVSMLATMFVLIAAWVTFYAAGAPVLPS